MMIIVRCINTIKLEGREEVRDSKDFTYFSRFNDIGRVSISEPTEDDINRYPDTSIDMVLTIGSCESYKKESQFVIGGPLEHPKFMGRFYLVDTNKTRITFNTKEEALQEIEKQRLQGANYIDRLQVIEI